MKHLKLFESRITYDRVIPRDLFNESKLLKCMGRLCLLIHDRTIPIEMTVDYDNSAFDIRMTRDGSLTIANLSISIKNEVVLFKTTYNNKSNFPLFAEYEDTEYLVFDERGEFDTEFLEFCKTFE